MIQDGSKVKFHYRLIVEGEELDTSRDGEPLEYTHGADEIVAGLEAVMTGLTVGDTRQVRIAPAEGYGERDEDAVQEVPKEAFGDVSELAVGDMVTGEISGQEFRAQVVEMAEESITLDLNHPLAGKTLEFDVEVVEVTGAST